MKTEIITLAGFSDTQLTATDAARQERDGLLAMSVRITNVNSLETANFAATALQSLADFTRQIEDARKDVKAPVIILEKKIDALARELTNELKAEELRIGKTLGAWQAEERRKEEDAQRKARDEEQRIWRDAQEKERIERDRLAKEEQDRADKARAVQADLEAKAARARSEGGKAKAEQEAEAAKIQAQIDADQRQAQAEADAERRREEAGKAMVAARVAGNQIMAKKPAGVATREDTVVEVTDVHALYKFNPMFVKLEANLTVIKSVLKSNPGQTIPGVSWHKEAKTHVR